MLDALGKSLLITLCCELFFSLIIGLRNRKTLAKICFVNLLTNPVAVLFFYQVLYRTNWNLFLITVFLEITVIVSEALFFKRFIPTVKKPWLFSASINLFSFAIGEIINSFV